MTDTDVIFWAHLVDRHEVRREVRRIYKYFPPARLAVDRFDGDKSPYFIL